MRLAVAKDPQAICRGADRFFDGKQLYDLEFGRAESATLTDQERKLGIT